MIRHIVLWKVRESEGRTREENAGRMVEALMRMKGRIPGVADMQAGVDIVRGEQSSDVALVMDFVDRGSLEAYRSHPLHIEFIESISEYRTERRTVDLETGQAEDA